jgi:hypothetical protein
MSNTSYKEKRIAQLNAAAVRIERAIKALKSDVGLELDEKAIAYLAAHPDVSYSDALAVAMEENVTLAREFTDSFNPGKLLHAADDDEDAGAEVDRLAQMMQREHPGLSYENILGKVRESHPDLWKKYAATKNG